MIEFIEKILIDYGVNGNLSTIISIISTLTIIMISYFVVDIMSKKVILRLVRAYISRSKIKWDDVLLENRVFDIIAHIPSALVIHVFAPVFPAYQIWIQRIVFVYIVVNVTLALNKVLDSVDAIYRKYPVSKIRPIKGYLQVLKIIMGVAVSIIVISVLINRSPWLLLSGLGAATAVLMLIFQNSILGFVASIQLTTNEMLKIGDWIEMPSNNADGDVIDLSIHTVKVQNFDKTITTIPTHLMISQSFKNWRGMQESGGRRIKRSVYIDATSIKFCDEEMLKRFEEIQYIKEYIEEKKLEIDKYNKEHNIDTSSIVNGRHLTNIGTFRAYIGNYLKNHPRINKNMIHMTRQLQPTEKGVPIEIYAFTDTVVWLEYEAIQSDIFDHILSIIPEFELRIYQSPTGHDLKKLGNKD